MVRPLEMLILSNASALFAHDTSFERLYKVGSNGWFVYPCFDKASSRERDRERSVVAFNGEVYSFSFIAFHVHSTIQLAFLSSRRTFSALSRSISNMSVF